MNGEEVNLTSEPGRAAFEWGLASIAVGGVLIASAVPALFAGQEAILRGHTMNSWNTLALFCAAALMNLTALAAVTFGVRSALLARRSGRPAALAAAGSLLGVLALALWSGITLAWYGLFSENWY